MCIVSMVIDYEKNRNPIFPLPGTVPYPRNPGPWALPDTNPFPHPLPSEGTPFDMSKILPNIIKTRDPTPEEIEEWIKKNRHWTKEKFDQLMLLIEEAKRMDALMGEPDCEDPLKVKFLDELKKLVGYMEAKQKARKPKKPKPRTPLKMQIKLENNGRKDGPRVANVKPPEMDER